MISIVASMLRHSDADVTMLYGNRTSQSVMFAEELADLKNLYGPRFDLVHVLSREPRDVELFSGRLEADRLRRLLAALVPVGAVDHVWLCGPFGLIADARTVLEELGVEPGKVHFELFYVDEPPPELHRADKVVSGDHERRHDRARRAYDDRADATRPERARRRRRDAQRPAVRLQGRGVRHLPGQGHRRRGRDAAQLRPRGRRGRAPASC